MQTISPSAAQTLSAIVKERRSVRGYKKDPVPPTLLRSIFERAQAAPSWCNIQPWQVYILSGSAVENLKSTLVETARSGIKPNPDFPWPDYYPEPYLSRRRACGGSLYAAMGVAREDQAARKDAWIKNYEGFGAPHLAFVYMDKRIELYPALDIGCWLQTVMLLAQAEGLATCAQASLAMFPDPVRAFVDAPQEQGLLCGLAIGYEDAEVPANRCEVGRAELAENVRFFD